MAKPSCPSASGSSIASPSKRASTRSNKRSNAVASDVKPLIVSSDSGLPSPQTLPVPSSDDLDEWWREAEYIAAGYTPAIGRPSVITDIPRVSKYLRKLASGNYQEVACRLSGLIKQNVSEWRQHADDKTHQNVTAFQRFADAEKRAEAAGEDEQVQNTRNAAKDPRFWAAGMTLLERRFPDRWARRSEESAGPRVVVQIGVKDSDVQVQIGEAKPTFRSSLSPLSDSESLTVTP